MIDAPTLIAVAMTEEERTTFLKIIHEHNPNMRGAHVADVLDIMAQHDSHVGVVEEYLEQHQVEHPSLLGAAVRAMFFIKGGQSEVRWEDVEELMKRVQL